MSSMLLKPKKVLFGGRFIFTVNQKKNAHIFHINMSDDVTPRTAILGFKKRNDAKYIGYLLENKKKIDNEGIDNVIDKDMDLDILELQDFYINKWDSYHLYEVMMENNMNLIVVDLDMEDSKIKFNGKLYEPYDNIHQYIDKINNLYDDKKQDEDDNEHYYLD